MTVSPSANPVRVKSLFAGATAQALLWTLLGFVALQLWRPCYFLTDDNLDGTWPLYTAAMRRLWHGQSPFYEPNIFGGYNLLRDPSLLGFWNPLTLLLSPLSLTKWDVFLIDILAAFHLSLAVVGMVALGRHFRERDALPLSERRLAFLGFSYAFSIYALSLGASWQLFLANIAVLPWIVLGLWHPQRKRGVALVAGGLLYGLMGGHSHPWVWTVFFGSLLAVGSCWERRTSWPLACWFGGLILALVVAAPFLWPALAGFGGSSRSALNASETTTFRMPLGVLLLSWPLGTFSIVSGQAYNALTLALGHSYALACCAAGGCLWHSWGAKRRLSRLEWLCIAGAMLAGLMILRPDALVALFSHLPILRSLRWPFREVLFLIFFLHWFMMLRPVAWPRLAAFASAGAGVLVWLVSLGLAGPPSFAPMEVDRELVLSGEARHYWEQVKTVVMPGTRFVTVVPGDMPRKKLNEIPWSLLGGFNYPAYFEVPSLSGYTIRGFQRDRFGSQSRHHSGVFTPAEGRILRQQANVGVVALKSLQPPRITLDEVNFSKEQPLPIPEIGPNR